MMQKKKMNMLICESVAANRNMPFIYSSFYRMCTDTCLNVKHYAWMNIRHNYYRLYSTDNHTSRSALRADRRTFLLGSIVRVRK